MKSYSLQTYVVTTGTDSYAVKAKNYNEALRKGIVHFVEDEKMMGCLVTARLEEHRDDHDDNMVALVPRVLLDCGFIDKQGYEDLMNRVMNGQNSNN